MKTFEYTDEEGDMLTVAPHGPWMHLGFTPELMCAEFVELARLWELEWPEDVK